MSLGAVFGIIAVGISGSLIFAIQRRRQRRQRELSRALASARASFSSRNADPRYQTILEDILGSSSSVKQSPIHLINRRLEWIRFGLDSPPRASHPSKSQHGPRFIEGRPLLHDYQSCFNNSQCCVHPPNAQGRFQMTPSPLGTAPVWTMNASNETRGAANSVNVLDPSLCQTQAPDKHLDIRRKLQARQETLASDLDSSTIQNNLLKDSPGDATPPLPSDEVVVIKNPSPSSDSVAFGASYCIHTIKNAGNQGTKLDWTASAASKSSHDALASLFSPSKERIVSASQSEASDITFDSSAAESLAEGRPSSLLAPSSAMLLSPHLEAILASASSASLFCPPASSTNSIRTYASYASMLPNSPLPPPAIIVSPPSDASFRSDSSVLSHNRSFGYWGQSASNLIHSEDDFVLPESGSWSSVDDGQYSDEDIAKIVEEAKRAEAFAESLCAAIEDENQLIRYAANGHVKPSIPCYARSSLQSPRSPSAIPVLSSRVKIATSP